MWAFFDWCKLIDGTQSKASPNRLTLRLKFTLPARASTSMASCKLPNNLWSMKLRTAFVSRECRSIPHPHWSVEYVGQIVLCRRPCNLGHLSLLDKTCGCCLYFSRGWQITIKVLQVWPKRFSFLPWGPQVLAANWTLQPFTWNCLPYIIEKQKLHWVCVITIHEAINRVYFTHKRNARIMSWVETPAIFRLGKYFATSWSEVWTRCMYASSWMNSEREHENSHIWFVPTCV